MFVHEVPRKFNLCVCVCCQKKKDRLTQFLRLALKYAPWKLVSNDRLGPLRAFVDMHEFKKSIFMIQFCKYTNMKTLFPDLLSTRQYK